MQRKIKKMIFVSIFCFQKRFTDKLQFSGELAFPSGEGGPPKVVDEEVALSRTKCL